MTEIIFRTDLASSHCARQTRKKLQIKNIPFVLKENNPPNVPQVRSIEEFCALLSGKVNDN